MTDIFSATAPHVMADLMRDFPIGAEDAAAILGNIGHECQGFRTLQEIKPVVAGSAGGYGWAQWTGPRRRAYEAFCKTLSVDPASDKANYGFLLEELLGSYKAAIAAVKAAKDLRAKVVAFESHYLWAGVKSYDDRLAWAQKALTAYRTSSPPPPDIEPTPAKSGGLFSCLKSKLKGA